ncbi:MAG TPA: hypothetical protein VGW34_09940 [Allosphingosinicella sp.]|nr:hypothetical protein [Allosphingosinicella sp.]
MKVAICTPVKDSPKLGYMDSLDALRAYTARERPDIEINRFTISTSTLPASRNHLAHNALAWGADWLFWNDDDQLFPANSLARLLDLGHAVVGCNYVRKRVPAIPTAYRASGELVYTTKALSDAGTVEEVAFLGMGLLLTRRDAIEAIPAPRFELRPDPNGLDFVTEDYVLCDKIRKAGGRIMLDHGLSWRVGHIGEFIYSHLHVAKQRPAAPS